MGYWKEKEMERMEVWMDIEAWEHETKRPFFTLRDVIMILKHIQKNGIATSSVGADIEV